MQPADIVRVLEAAYRPAPSDDAWLGAIFDEITPALDLGGGVVGAFYEANRAKGVRFWGVTPSRPEASGFAAVAGQREAHGGDDFMLKLWGGPSALVTVSKRSGLGARWLELPGVGEVAGALGVADVVGMITSDPSARGVGFLAPSPRVMNPSRADEALWARVAAHVAAGLRLRWRDAAPPDAVLSPSGKIEHAEGEARSPAAREALARAVKQSERARGKLRRQSAHEAVEMWRALVRGEWSLVDMFEHDGRRYVVAHKNDPPTRAWQTLTRRERQVVAFAALGRPNKLIAYELGLSTSGVAMTLARAAQKIGASSRVELIQAYAAHAERRRARRSDAAKRGSA